MYQSLLRKDKKIEELVKDNERLVSDCRKRESDLLTKVGQIQYEHETAKDMLEKTKKERDSLAQEKAMLKESLSKVQGEARLWQKEAEGLEKRLTLVQQDNQSLVKAREDFQNIINKKDEMLVSEQRKASEIRDQSESKMFELKTAFIELQKELEGIQNLNTQLKKQISQLEKERDSQADLALRKDNTIDKLKEEVVLMSKALQKTSQPSMPQDTAKELYEKVSSVEFARLRQLTDELKNKEIELERYRIQSELQERQYLTLKQQATAALEEKNNSKRAADSVRYENEKLKEEQDKFIDELSEIRQIYESQIDDLATKLHSSAEEVIKQKAKCSELTKENNILKYRLDEFKRRVASRDVEIQKLTSEHLFEAEGIPRAKPTDILASPSIVKVQLENESQFDMVSPEVKENGQKTLNKLRMMDEHEPKHDLWQEDKQKLDWDSLFYKLSTLGTK